MPKPSTQSELLRPAYLTALTPMIGSWQDKETSTVQIAAEPCTSESYIAYNALLCGTTRSLMAMESRAIAGGLSADHQLPEWRPKC